MSPASLTSRRRLGRVPKQRRASCGTAAIGRAPADRRRSGRPTDGECGAHIRLKADESRAYTGVWPPHDHRAPGTGGELPDV